MFYSLSEIGIVCFLTASLTIAVFLGLPKSELRGRCIQAAKYLMPLAWLLAVISPADFMPCAELPDGYIDDFFYILFSCFLVESARNEPIRLDH